MAVRGFVVASFGVVAWVSDPKVLRQAFGNDLTAFRVADLEQLRMVTRLPSRAPAVLSILLSIVSC